MLSLQASSSIEAVDFLPVDYVVSLIPEYDGSDSMITEIVAVLDHLTITGASSVNENTTSQYVCTAYYSDSTSAVVSPTWSESSPDATIDTNGLLTAGNVSSDQNVTITAAFGGKIDTYAITIKLHAPEPFVTVWQTTEPNQTIGYKGPVGATGYSGTISVYDNTTNELLSTNEYTGPEDDVLWPVLVNLGTYRIEIRGSFPFIQADIDPDDDDGGGGVHDPSLLIEVVSLGDTGLDPLGLEYAFCGCNRLQNCSLGTANITHITSLKNTWYACESLSVFPKVETLTGVTNLERTWAYCELMQTAPNVNTLTEVTTLAGTWEYCVDLINPSEVDALINTTSLESTWYDCESMQTAPNVNTLIWVNDLSFTWSYCVSMTSPSEVSNLTLVTRLYYTWSNCESLVVAPDIGNLTKVTNMGHMFYNCSSLQTVNIPYSINNLTTAWNMMRNSNNVPSMYIDNVLNSAWSSLLANGGEPKVIEMHLGTNNYTAAGLDAFDYLVTTAGWDVHAGELA